jgi:hypothetical protein
MDPFSLLAGVAGWKGLKSLPGFAAWVETNLDRRRRESILRDLNSLAFWNEGMLEPLSAIAEGRGEAHHCGQIKVGLAKTQSKVEDAKTRLLAVRDQYVSSVIGNSVSRALGDVVYRKTGSGGLRETIKLIAFADPHHHGAQEKSWPRLSEQLPANDKWRSAGVGG